MGAVAGSIKGLRRARVDHVAEGLFEEQRMAFCAGVQRADEVRAARAAAGGDHQLLGFADAQAGQFDALAHRGPRQVGQRFEQRMLAR